MNIFISLFTEGEAKEESTEKTEESKSEESKSEKKEAPRAEEKGTSSFINITNLVLKSLILQYFFIIIIMFS